METNEDLLFEKSEKSLKQTNSNYIVANILKDRYIKVYLINKTDKIKILKEGENNIEIDLINQIVNLHQNYILN